MILIAIVKIFSNEIYRIRRAFSFTNSRFKCHITLAVTSLTINFIFTCLNLPFALILFLPKISKFNIFVLTFYVYYGSYVINFYIMYLTNSLFRKKLHAMVNTMVNNKNDKLNAAN